MGKLCHFFTKLHSFFTYEGEKSKKVFLGLPNIYTLIFQTHSQLWSYLPETTRSPKLMTWWLFVPELCHQWMDVILTTTDLLTKMTAKLSLYHPHSIASSLDLILTQSHPHPNSFFYIVIIDHKALWLTILSPLPPSTLTTLGSLLPPARYILNSIWYILMYNISLLSLS